MIISQAIQELTVVNHIGIYRVFIRDYEKLCNLAPEFAKEICARRDRYPSLKWKLIYVGEAKGNGGLLTRFRQEFRQERQRDILSIYRGYSERKTTSSTK